MSARVHRLVCLLVRPRLIPCAGGPVGHVACIFLTRGANRRFSKGESIEKRIHNIICVIYTRHVYNIIILYNTYLNTGRGAVFLWSSQQSPRVVQTSSFQFLLHSLQFSCFILLSILLSFYSLLYHSSFILLSIP